MTKSDISAAKEMLKDNIHLTLSNKDWQIFNSMMVSPPAPNDALCALLNPDLPTTDKSDHEPSLCQ